MKRLAAALLFTFSVFAQAPAEPKPEVSDPRSSPQSTVINFLEACRRGQYGRAATFLSLPDGADGQRLARQLKDVLDTKFLRDPVTLSNQPEGTLEDGLPPDFELLDRVDYDGRQADLLLERVTRNETQIWLFSQKTLEVVPALYRSLGGRWIESRLPSWLLIQGPLDTALWQWLALLLVVVISAAFAALLARLVVRLLQPVVNRTPSDIDNALVTSVVKPMRLLLSLVAFRAGMVAVGASVLLRFYAGRVVTALIYFSLAWLAMRIIDVLAVKAIAGMTGRQRASASSMVPLAKRSAKAAAIVIAFLAALASFGYDTTALLAGLGVGGLAVALAAQKTIENLFGGVAITTDQPVLVGDFCRYGDKFGIVEDVGLRSTRVRTLDRTLVTIPNAQFSSMEIENYGRRDKIWFHPILNLRRDTTPEQVRHLIGAFRQVLLDHPMVDNDPARVRFIGIGPYSLDLEIFSYVNTASIDEFLVVQEELLLSILDRVAEAGTALAVPSQINFLSRDPQRERVQQLAAHKGIVET